MNRTRFGFSRGQYPAVDPSREPVPTLASSGGELDQTRRQEREDGALQRAIDALGRDLQREARP
jgi:hypothetical protein